MRTERITLFVVLATFSADTGFGQSAESVLTAKQTLAGTPRMSVAVDSSSIPGLSFRSDLESTLREAGITVVGSADRSPQYPQLQVTISGTISNQYQPPLLAYLIHLEFNRLFTLEGGRYVKATTWSSHRTGSTAWPGLIRASDVLAVIRKDVLTATNGFLDDWREENGGASAGVSRPVSHLFDGTWRGTYTCSGGLASGSGQSTWVVREVSPGRVQAVEQWFRFLSGRNSYTGTINGRNLEVKTQDMGGYEIQFALAEDNVTLRGRYIGHPNGCQTVLLHKAQ